MEQDALSFGVLDGEKKTKENGTVALPALDIKYRAGTGSRSQPLLISFFDSPNPSLS